MTKSVSPGPPRNLWSNPETGRADVEELKAALEELQLSATDVEERREAAAERVRAFRTGVSFATLASRTD